jgi:hypothetical protein
MKKLLVALLLLASPAYAQKTKTALTSEVNTNLASGTGITASTLRATLTDMINSWYDLNGTSSATCSAHNWISALPSLSSQTCTQPSVLDVSGWGTSVLAAMQVAVGSAGGPVLFNGVGGTPSSITLTNGLGLPVGGMAAQGANTFIANVTSGSAIPTAATLPPCTGVTAALQYTAGTGLSCGTISASATSITPLTTTVGGGTNTDLLAVTTSSCTSGSPCLAQVPNVTGSLSDVVTPTTWTPSDQSGATLTFTSVTAIYTRIGKHVVAQFRLTYPSTANASAAAIGGLPVASSSSGGLFAAGSCVANLASNGLIGILMGANTTQFGIAGIGTSGAGLTNANLTTVTLTCTISYISN